MIGWRKLEIAGLMLTTFSVGAATDANACTPPSKKSIEENSDAIVEGAFFVDSEERGEGHVVVKRTLHGARRQTFRVRWDPHPELNSQPHELDCVVTVPASGDFEGFNLKQDDDGWHSIIGRWQRVQKVR